MAARATGRARRATTVEYVAHPPRAGGTAPLAGPVDVGPEASGGFARSRAALGGPLGARGCAHAARSRPAIARADVVHAHSNGLLAELAVLLATARAEAGRADALRHRDLALRAEEVRPGSFHARVPRGVVRDVLQRSADGAGAASSGSTGATMHAVYPPVSAAVRVPRRRRSAASRARRSGSANAHLLLNVKRLHPLAGQRHLIEAMNEVIRMHPDTRLVICGTGPLLDELQGGRAVGRRRAARDVRRAGRQRRRSRATAPRPISSSCRRCWRRCRPSPSRRSRAGTPVLSTTTPAGSS